MVSAVLRRLTVPLAIAGLIVVAGFSLNRVYNGTLLVGLVALAAVGSVLVSATLRRAPAWLVAPVSVAAMVGFCAYAVQLSARAGGVAGDLRSLGLDAAKAAVPRLLTALIPVEPQPDTVLGPVVLAWLAGFAGAELAARGRRPAVGLIPPTLLYAGSLVLVGPNAEFTLWQPLAFAGFAALVLVAAGANSGVASLPDISRTERAALRLRTASGLLVGLVAVLAVVTVAAPLIAAGVGQRPIDPRSYVQPPSLEVLDQNPLIRISGWAANPDQELFGVQVLHKDEPAAAPADQPTPAPSPSGPDVVVVPTEEPDGGPTTQSADEPDESTGAYDTRLRLAVLEEWDGVTWHVNADYRNAGRVLPAPFAPPGQALEGSSDSAPPLRIEEQITVDQLQGRLMPAISAPQRVDGVRVAFDQGSGTLLYSSPLSPGVSYRVTSVNRSVDVNLLPAADVPAGPDVARLLAVGDTVPQDLVNLANEITAGEGSPYLKAYALESFLSEHYAYAADAPSGHSYPNLRFFLFDPPRAGGQKGTSEQFATAFATLGRLMGLPTRVVVGFNTPAGGGTVTAGDALAWPEVLFAGVGWVAFNPMPQPDVPPRPLEDEYLPKPTPPTTPPATVEPPEPTTTAVVPKSSEQAAPPAGPGAYVVAGGVGGGVLVLLVLFLIVITFLRWLQRRGRLSRGSPPQRVLGAWDEVLDALDLDGSSPPPHLAAAEVAAHAARVVEVRGSGPRHGRRPRPAAPPLEDLATKVNAVGFSGHTSATGGADEVSAHTAGLVAGDYVRALRSRRSLWRRILWRINPRPLLGSRRPRG